MGRHAAVVPNKETQRKAKFSHQFLQQKNNGGFEMALVDKLKPFKTYTMSSREENKKCNQASPPLPIGFKPLITSTPKRNKSALDAVNKQNLGLGPCRTLSQFIDVLPCTSKKLDEIPKSPNRQVAVKLQNFVGLTPNTTIVIDDFMDTEEFLPVTPSTTWPELIEQDNYEEHAQPKSVAQMKMNETFIISKSRLNSRSKGTTRNPEVFKKKKKSILNIVSPDDTFAKFEKLIKKQSVCDTTSLALNDSMRITLEHVFNDSFDRKSFAAPKLRRRLSRIPRLKSSAKPSKVYNQPKQAMNFVTNDSTFMNLSLFNLPKQNDSVQDSNLKNLFASHEDTSSDFLLKKNIWSGNMEQSSESIPDLEKNFEIFFQTNDQPKRSFVKDHHFSTSTVTMQLDNLTLNRTEKEDREVNNDVEFWKTEEDPSLLGELLKIL